MFQGWQDYFFFSFDVGLLSPIIFYDVANKSASHGVHNVMYTVSAGSPAASDIKGKTKLDFVL